MYIRMELPDNKGRILLRGLQLKARPGICLTIRTGNYSELIRDSNAQTTLLRVDPRNPFVVVLTLRARRSEEWSTGLTRLLPQLCGALRE
jgi:hypothetical protein